MTDMSNSPVRQALDEGRFRAQYDHIFADLAAMLERDIARLPAPSDVPASYKNAYRHLRASIGSAMRSIDTLRSPDVTPARVVHDFTRRAEADRPEPFPSPWDDETNGHYLTAWDVISQPWVVGPVLSALSVGGTVYWFLGG